MRMRRRQGSSPAKITGNPPGTQKPLFSTEVWKPSDWCWSLWNWQLFHILTSFSKNKWRLMKMTILQLARLRTPTGQKVPETLTQFLLIHQSWAETNLALVVPSVRLCLGLYVHITRLLLPILLRNKHIRSYSGCKPLKTLYRHIHKSFLYSPQQPSTDETQRSVH